MFAAAIAHEAGDLSTLLEHGSAFSIGIDILCMLLCLALLQTGRGSILTARHQHQPDELSLTMFGGVDGLSPNRR